MGQFWVINICESGVHFREKEGTQREEKNSYNFTTLMNNRSSENKGAQWHNIIHEENDNKAYMIIKLHKIFIKAD